MGIFTFPTNAMITEIAQDKIATMILEDIVFRFFPMVSKDAPVIMWEQRDNYLGLQQLRGLGGSPQRVKATGGKRIVYEPGVFGEFDIIDETEMTMRRPYGDFQGMVSLDSLVMEKQDKLLVRRVNRIRQILWTLLTTGTFSVSLPTGGIGYLDSYAIQTYAGSAWSTPGSGTPLADFSGAQLLSLGHSVDFGSRAVALMNRVTWNRIARNTNAADYGGKRVTGGNTVNGLAAFNAVLLGEDLPQIQIYDDSYLDESGTPVRFIPTGKTVIIGERPGGDPVGEYIMTLNVNNPGMASGPYQKIIDKSEDHVPAVVEVHDGHNGGPAIYYPSAVIVMTTT